MAFKLNHGLATVETWDSRCQVLKVNRHIRLLLGKGRKRLKRTYILRDLKHRWHTHSLGIPNCTPLTAARATFTSWTITVMTKKIKCY
jgi:hypothetical protein